MYNYVDMFELIDGEKEHVNTLWCIIGETIITVHNIQEYNRLKIDSKGGESPRFWLDSNDLGDVYLGDKVFDDIEECITEFGFKFGLR